MGHFASWTLSLWASLVLLNIFDESCAQTYRHNKIIIHIPKVKQVIHKHVKELVIKTEGHSSPHNNQHEHYDHFDHHMVNVDNSEGGYKPWTVSDHPDGGKGVPSNDEDIHAEGTHHKETYDSRGFGIRPHGVINTGMNDNLDHHHKVEFSHGERLRYKNNIHKYPHEMLLYKKPKRSHIPKHMVILRNSKPSSSMHIIKIKPIYTMNDGKKVIQRPLRSHKPIQSPNPVSHSVLSGPQPIKEINGPIEMFDGGSSTDTFSSINFGNYDSGHIMFEGSFKDHFKDHLKMFDQQSHSTDIPNKDKFRIKHPNFQNLKAPEIPNNNQYLLTKNKFKNEVLLKKNPNQFSNHKFNHQIHHTLSHKPNLQHEYINYLPEIQAANDLNKETNRPSINEVSNLHSSSTENGQNHQLFENTGELSQSSANPNFNNQNFNQNQQEISTLKTTYSLGDTSTHSYSNSNTNTNIGHSNNNNQHFNNINFPNDGKHSGSNQLTPSEDSKIHQFNQDLSQTQLPYHYSKDSSQPNQENSQHFFENSLKTYPSLTTHSSVDQGSNSYFSNSDTSYFSKPNNFENVKFPQNGNVESLKGDNAVNFNSGSQHSISHSHTINHNGDSGPTSYTSFTNGDAISESSSIETNKNKHGGYSVPSGSNFPNPGYSYFPNRPSYEVREEAKDDSLSSFSSFFDLPKLKVNNSSINSVSFLNLDNNIGTFAEPLGPITSPFGSPGFLMNSFQRKSQNINSENMLTS